MGPWDWLHLEDSESFVSLQQSAAVEKEETEHSKKRNDRGTRWEGLIDGEVVSGDRVRQSDTLFNSWLPMSEHLREKQAMNRGLGYCSDFPAGKRHNNHRYEQSAVEDN